MEAVGGVLSAFGLAASAGLNAYVPLLMVALIAGVLVAGGVHLVKSAAVRPAVSVTTAGVANVPVSIAEDILATILSILAIVVPVVVAVVLILLTAFVIWLLWRRASRITQAPGA